MGLLDFHYPTRWPMDRKNGFQPNKSGMPERTLILSGVFPLVHEMGNRIEEAVLSLERSDRKFAFMVLARVPIISHKSTKFEDFLHSKCGWCGCGGGYTEVMVAQFDAGHDHAFFAWKHRWGDCEFIYRLCDAWYIWLAAGIALRANGFTPPDGFYPFRSRYND
jgi:hypothetical protein